MKPKKPSGKKYQPGFHRHKKGASTAIVKFHPLPDQYCPKGREHRHWARISSQVNGLIVFPDHRLEQFIRSKGLVGKSMEVQLRCLRNKDNKGKRFEASIPPAGLKEVRPAQPLRCCQAPIFVIDGRNFLLTMRKVVEHYGEAVSPLEVINGIMGLFNDPPSTIRMYLCESDLREFHQENEVIAKFFAELNRQRQNPKYAIIDARKPKTVFVHHRPKRHKRDMDHVILPSIGFLASEHQQAQALVLFTGDGDFLEASRIWLGLNGHDSDQSPLNRQLVIVSSQIREQNGTGALAQELRELANKPCVTLALLEHLL